MKRLFLAGVSLTVTACAMQPGTPSSTASASTSRGPASEYLLALAATPQCTLWRDVGGQRVCLDGAVDQPAKAAAAPAPTRRVSRLERAPGEDFNDVHLTPAARPAPAAAAPIAVVAPASAPAKAQAAARRTPAPEMPRTAAVAMLGPDLAEEMQRIGMLDSSQRVKHALPRVKLAQADAAAAMPALPKPPGAAQAVVTPPVIATADMPQLPKAAQGVISAPQSVTVPIRQSFAPDPGEAMAKPAGKPAAARPADAAAQRWQPVDKQPARTQVAAGETMQRAPVAPVERAELPSVRPTTIVPLKITEKGVDGKPSVVEPAMQAAPTSITPTSLAAAPQPAAPDLPALPNLPPVPGSSAAAQSAPIASPAPITAAPSLPAIPTAAVKTPAPAAQAKAPAIKAQAAKSTAKPAPEKMPLIAPAAAPARSGARYLVLHSFQDQKQAAQAAQKYSQLGATVATAQVQGQTWHRVVVRDGSDQRSRLTAAGVRGFWPVTL